MVKTKTQLTSGQTVPINIIPDTEIIQQASSIVVFRATKAMTRHEYEELSARIRTENKASGLKIVLAPAIVDGIEISG